MSNRVKTPGKDDKCDWYKRAKYLRGTSPLPSKNWRPLKTEEIYAFLDSYYTHLSTLTSEILSLSVREILWCLYTKRWHLGCRGHFGCKQWINLKWIYYAHTSITGSQGPEGIIRLWTYVPESEQVSQRPEHPLNKQAESGPARKE